METPHFKFDCSAGTELNFVILSDLHLDSPASRLDRFRRFRDASAKKLKNAYYVCLGDVADAIPPHDKRWSADRRRMEKERWQDWLLEFFLKEFGDMRWLWLCKGNHDIKHENQSGTSPVQNFCERTKTYYGGYAGFARLQFDLGSRHSHVLKWLYSHGRWGGRLAKGYNGCMSWAQDFSDWDICTIGHNHSARIDPMTKISVSSYKDSSLKETNRFFATVPSWLQTWEIGTTSYSEMGGYGAAYPWPAYCLRVIPEHRKVRMSIIPGDALW